MRSTSVPLFDNTFQGEIMKMTGRMVAILSLLVLVLAGCAPLSQDAEEAKPRTTRTAEPRSTDCEEGMSFSEEFQLCIPTESSSSSNEVQLTQDAEAFFSSANEEGRLDYAATTQYLEASIAHLDTIWSGWFAGEGYPEPWVGYTIIQEGSAFASACTMADGVNTFPYDYSNAIYCHLDPNQSDMGMIILPVGTMAKMWTGEMFTRQVSDLRFAGDFAAAMITAHEFGHHIQFELAEVTGYPLAASPNFELIADCFAGVWAYTVAVDGYLEEGDIDEALYALAAIGDNSGSHGTSDERMTAFVVGAYGTTADARGGVPYNCISTYWPGFYG